MTIDAKNKTFTIPQSSDGKVYARYSSGRYVAPTLTVAGWGQTANGSIEPSGPITGPVPLAIFCHAIGTESSNASLDTFRENGYRFDFGYGNVYSAGTWTHSGKPKGEQVGGPVAAHVYETPGTYILSLRVKDPTGNSYDLKTKIVAVDANNYWTSEGRTTTLLANASTSVWPTWANNTRYLLEAGKDYRRLGSISFNSLSNVSIQNYGLDGKINSCSIASGGSGYTSGTYTYVPLWRGVGWGASANITVSSGVVTSVTIANTGSGYVVGDILTVYDGTGAEIGSSGSGFSLNVDSIVNETDNKPITHDIYLNSTGSPTTPRYLKRVSIIKIDANSKTNTIWQQSGNWLSYSGHIEIDFSSEDILIYKSNCTQFIVGQSLASSYISAGKVGVWPRPRRIFLYENTANTKNSFFRPLLLEAQTLNGGTVNFGEYPLFNADSYDSAVLGNIFTDSAAHDIRIASMQIGTISHNHAYLPGGSGERENITIRSQGYGNLSPTIFDYNATSNSSFDPATRYVIVADNKIGNTTDSIVPWTQLAIKPVNESYNGSHQFVMAERNIHTDVSGISGNTWSTMEGGKSIIIRDAVYQRSGVTKGVGSLAVGPAGWVAPQEWKIGPHYSNQFRDGELNNANSFFTATAILPPRPIANVEVYLTVRGWGQEVPAGGSIVGPAPLVIYFDAVDTRSANANTNTFREFGYYFDFGYDSANAAIVGNWQYSNKTKISQIGGPLAAHMYEIPGTYTASVRAQNPQGEYQDKFVTIVVQDANVVYSGTKTVLVSNTGASDASYPSAATYNIAASGVVSFQSDKRYLFKAGENYSSYGVNALTSNVYRFQIGTFGSGAKPVVNLGNNGIASNPTNKKLTAGIIQKINVNNMVIGYANDVHYNDCERYTGGFSGLLDASLLALNHPDANNQWPINCGIWNSSYIANTTPSGGIQCFYGGGKYLTFVGNDPYNGSHIFRSGMAYRGFVAHNRLNKPANDTLHQVKLFGGSSGNFTGSYPSSAYEPALKGNLPFNSDVSIVADFPMYGFENRYVVIADNVISPANNNWQVALKPQNSNADERVRDVIVERIIFQDNTGATNSAQKAVKMEGQNLVVRDCTVGTRLATNHYSTLSPKDLGGNFLPISVRGPYYIPAPHPDIGTANNTFASVTGIIPERPGTYLSETITPSLISSGWGQNVSATGTITGPVPLAVFFDATATTSSDSSIDTFNEIHYHFDFGYANTYTPGTWTHSGKPKGNQIGGPIAAHVYETPGTYKATVRAQDINGRYYDANVNIVAVDAHTYWTGSGKTNTTITVASGAWPTWANNTRYNLEAGGNYASFGTITINGRYNVAINGNKANVGSIIIESSGSKRAWSNSITISDITSTQSIDVNLPSEYVSFIRANTTSVSYGTSLKGSYDSTSGWYWPRYQTLYDCNFENSNTSVTGIWSTQSQQIAIMGCSSGNAKEHCVRTQNIYKLFFAHNFLYKPGTSAGPKHFLAIRAQGLSPWRTEYNGTDDMQSKYAVVADNKVGIGTETGHASNFKFSPNNDGVAHWVDMVRTERNTFNTSDAIRCIEGECTNLTSFETGMPDPFEGQITHGTLTTQYLGPYYSNQHRTGTDGTKRFNAPTQFYPLKAKS